MAAAVLLQQRGEGFDYVVLHLWCQGLEIFLKGLLLMKDSEAYHPRLRSFNHNLILLVDEAHKIFKLNKIRPDVADELKGLSVLYCTNRLRYASFYDILVDSTTIPRKRLMMRTVAALRLAERQIALVTPPSGEQPT